MSMPDESCRMCGKPLYFFSKCSVCKDTVQQICLNCGNKTLFQYHNCMPKSIKVSIS